MCFASAHADALLTDILHSAMRTIFHCDINNCFASIEIARDPSLAGKPVAVCGDPGSRRGIVLAKSEQAKKFGVATGDPIWMARKKCPDLVCVAPHFELYEAYSAELRRYYARYTPFAEPFGLDECWLDLTDNVRRGAPPEVLAETIRADIKRIFEVTASIGVSFNKVFAKLGSDMKKPDAVTYIPHDRFREIIWHLPASALLDVGPSTAQKLLRIGISTIGRLALAPLSQIEKCLGKNGRRLWQWANGMDDSPVAEQTDAKLRRSIGHGATMPHDAENLAQLRPWVMAMAERVAFGLQREGLAGRGLQITVRDALLRFETYQYRSCDRYESSESIAAAALGIIAQRYDWALPLRGVGVRVCDLFAAHKPYQPALFDLSNRARRERICRIDKTIAAVQEKYGAAALARGFALDMPDVQPAAFPMPRLRAAK